MVNFHNFQYVIYPFFDIGLPGAAHLQAESHIIPYRHMGEYGIVLKHHAHIPFLYRHIIDTLSIQPDFAFFNGIESDNHTK